MISDSKHTIFDNVKAHKIKSGYIQELDIESKPISINNTSLELW